MKDEILITVDLSRNQMDNEYRYYKSGKVERFFDSHGFSLNNQVVINDPTQISTDIKKEFIKKCPARYLTRLQKVLGVKVKPVKKAAKKVTKTKAKKSVTSKRVVAKKGNIKKGRV